MMTNTPSLHHLGGKFITFEGGEGCGKSTQARLLHESLIRSHIPCILTREPGGTTLGEKLRDFILKDSEIEDPVVEYMLITAARRHHLTTVIKPALAQGKAVICDRFTHSTLAYQVMMKGMERELFTILNHHLLLGCIPDLTIYIDLAPELALVRLQERNDAKSVYDRKDLAFHQRLRACYLEIMHNESKAVIIDGNQSVEVVARVLLAAL